MIRRTLRARLLLLNVLVVAVCGLLYELLCGTVASYLLGDAVLEFSLVLGAYVAALGAGAWASRRFEPFAAGAYVGAEILLALVGGLSVPLLLAAAAAHAPLRPVLYTLVFAIGALVGLELPLLVRILRDDPEPTSGFADVVARALAFDYVGALAASLLFPLVLVPRLGVVRTSIVTGAANALVALAATFVLRLDRGRRARASALGALAILSLAFVRSEAWVMAAD